MSKKVIVIGAGVAVVAGLGWYLYNKNKSAQAASAAALAPGGYSDTTATLPASSSPSYSPSSPSQAPVSAIGKQKLFKDKDGNVFEMTADKQKWGYTIKVNGGVQKKSNQMVVMVLGPDGYMIGADNNGSTYQYKNGGWAYVIKDDKNKTDQYLRQFGISDYLSLNGFNGFRGFGNPAYLLS